MSETAAEKPAFRDAVRRRRCLIPADAFYEWERIGKKAKQPYSFGMIDDSVFAFAGLWEHWRDPAGEFVETCTILTTRPELACGRCARSNARDPEARRLRPVVRPGMTNVALIADVLRPFDPRLMKKYPVSTRVNRAENDDCECAKEVPIASTAQTLFRNSQAATRIPALRLVGCVASTSRRNSIFQV
jgi:hypothetical protein